MRAISARERRERKESFQIRRHCAEGRSDTISLARVSARVHDAYTGPIGGIPGDNAADDAI